MALPPAPMTFRILLWVLVASAVCGTLSEPEPELGPECNWCGPQAERVHRRRRAPSCDSGNFTTSTCEFPDGYCAIVATSPPYSESRTCVKVHQDACYPTHCSTSRQQKIVCACHGDRCNGEKTEREIRAFSVLKEASKRRQKRNDRTQNHFILRMKIVNPDDSKKKKSTDINNNLIEELNNETRGQTITDPANKRKMIEITFDLVSTADNQSKSDNKTTPLSMIDVNIIQPPTKVSLVQTETEVQINRSTTELSENMQIPKPTRMMSEFTEPTLPPMETVATDPDHTEKQLDLTNKIGNATATTVVNTLNEIPVESPGITHIQPHAPKTERDESQQTYVLKNNTEKMEQNGANEKDLSELPQKDAPELSTEKVQQKFHPQPNNETPQKDEPAMDSEQRHQKYTPLPTIDTTLPKVNIDIMKQTSETPIKTAESATVPSVNKNAILSSPHTIKEMKNIALKTYSDKLAFICCIAILLIKQN